MNTCLEEILSRLIIALIKQKLKKLSYNNVIKETIYYL
jgi:hypothetical protein